MADLAIDFTGQMAEKRELAHVTAGTWGRDVSKNFQETLASLAQNEVIAIGIMPANIEILDWRYHMAALGASTGIKLGYRQVDDISVNDDDAFATEADTSSITNGRCAVVPLTFENPIYVIATQTGVGTASGVVTFIPTYRFIGGN